MSDRKKTAAERFGDILANGSGDHDGPPDIDFGGGGDDDDGDDGDCLPFLIGDVVSLNSGGPRMTVVGVDEDGVVTTAHFNDDGVLFGAEWPADALCYCE